MEKEAVESPGAKKAKAETEKATKKTAEEAVSAETKATEAKEARVKKEEAAKRARQKSEAAEAEEKARKAKKAAAGAIPISFIALLEMGTAEDQSRYISTWAVSVKYFVDTTLLQFLRDRAHKVAILLPTDGRHVMIIKL